MSRKKQQESFSMVRTGTNEDYEVYSILPSSVTDSVQSKVEISTHYKHDTDGIYGDNDDVVVKDVTTVEGKKYSYIQFPGSDAAPYLNQELVSRNMVMSRCQAFNIQAAYGQGLRFLDRETGELTEDDEIRSFCLSNALHLQWIRMCTDMEYHFFSVMVIHLSRDHSKIVQVRMRHACDCRFEPRETKYGVIEHVIVSDFREGHLKTVEAIPLLDEIDPLGDLKFRVGSGCHIYSGEKGVKPADGKDCKFAILCLMPTPGYRYYPVPYYTSIYKDAWYDIYRLIGLGKRYMIKNTSAPRIQVEVHRTYWDNVCREENITDKVKRAERIKKERQNITDFCTKPENAGKAWVTSYDTTPEGKEKRMVRIYNLNENNKKEGGDWSDDMQEASNSLCFAMGVHPNMVGAVPGKSQMNNSGSDKRELFTLKQALEKAMHDIMAVPFHVILHYNGWDKKYKLDVPIIQLTTLDENKDAKESTVNTEENGNNNQGK